MAPLVSIDNVTVFVPSKMLGEVVSSVQSPAPRVFFHSNLKPSVPVAGQERVRLAAPERAIISCGTIDQPEFQRFLGSRIYLFHLN